MRARELLLWSGLCVSGVACNDYDLNPYEPPNAAPDTGGPPADDGDDPGDGGDLTTASVRGRVCDFSGEGYVVGAQVHAAWDTNGDGENDSSATASTDENGWFQLEGLPLGEHRIVVEKGSFSTTFDVVITQPGLLELAEEECLEQDDVRIAVITGEFDNIGAILSGMDLEFDTYGGSWSGDYLDLLLDPEDLAEYDIVFFNCGISDSWTPYQIEVSENIEQFVQAGGSIYASDWAYFFFETAFPDLIDFVGDDAVYVSETTGGPPPAVGARGRIDADIYDANMMAVIGSNRADLNYDLDGWVVPISTLSTAEVMVRGDARTYTEGTLSNVPLAVKVVRGGTAIFTTFHNERQLTIDMERLLEEIILNL